MGQSTELVYSITKVLKLREEKVKDPVQSFPQMLLPPTHYSAYLCSVKRYSAPSDGL